MQVKEILLCNTPQSLFIKNDDKYKKEDYVVISNQGNLDLAIVKNTVEVEQNTELVDVVRIATKQDLSTNCENCKYAKTLLPTIKREADKLHLDMKISFISVNLDKTKVIVNYTADERVDFRELLKVLASKIKSRIEMRQIGNRDETKMVGAMGVCGRVCCCKSFLSDFDKVSIKMAKNQEISLNPNKINGMCGRLLCCLKYEDETYEEIQKKMPKIGFDVVTPDGKGTVTARDILAEKVTVTFNKDDSVEVKIYDLKDIRFKPSKN